MNIQPAHNKIQIQVQEASIGALTMTNQIVNEFGTVIAFGKTVAEKMPDLQIGDKIYFKAWALDEVKDEDGTVYYWISTEADAILGYVRQ